MKIAIIGAGSVGTNLHHAFALKDVRTELIHARPLTAEQPGEPQNNQTVEGFDVYIYAVADQALREVIAKIDAPKALHLHTSGSMPIEVFGEDKPHSGIMYFFQSFSLDVMIDDWSGIPCFISGHNIDDIAAIYSLAQTLTSRIYEVNQHDRERLHVAGVFANNFSNLMYRIAAEILRDTQIPFEALLPLIDRTAEKVHTLPPKEAQTGPAQRMDREVIMKHLAVLDGMKDGEFFASDIEFIYMNLSQIIQTAQWPEDRRHSIMEILGQALEGSSEKGHIRPAQARRRGKYPEE